MNDTNNQSGGEMTKEARTVLILSVGTGLFFLFVFCTFIFRWEAIIVGVFWELLMLPSLVMLLGLLGFVALRAGKVDRTTLRYFLIAMTALLVPVLMLVVASWLEWY